MPIVKASHIPSPLLVNPHRASSGVPVRRSGLAVPLDSLSDGRLLVLRRRGVGNAERERTGALGARGNRLGPVEVLEEEQAGEADCANANGLRQQPLRLETRQPTVVGVLGEPAKGEHVGGVEHGAVVAVVHVPVRLSAGRQDQRRGRLGA